MGVLSFLSRRPRSGVAVVEFAVVAPVLIVTTLIGIYWGIHVTKRFVLDRALDAKTQVVLLNTGPDRDVLASLAFERTFTFPAEDFASYLFTCVAGPSPTCIEAPDARSGALAVSNVTSRVLARVASFPVSLPAGERFGLVVAFMDEPAARAALRMMLQTSSGFETMVVSVVPLPQ